MIDGINVLHTFQHTSGLFTSVGLWIVFSVFVLATIYAWILVATRRTRPHVIVAIVVSLLMFGFLFGATHTPVQTETRYKIIIDDDVSYREFTNMYEVLDVEGEIYTVRLRGKLVEETPDATYPSEEAVG